MNIVVQGISVKTKIHYAGACSATRLRYTDLKPPQIKNNIGKNVYKNVYTKKNWFKNEYSKIPQGTR